MFKFTKAGIENIHVFDLNISLFLSIVSLGIVRFYLHARTGFDISYADINNVSGISLFILLAPLMLNTLDALYLHKNRTKFIGYGAISTLATVASLIVCSYLVILLGYWLLSVIAVLGYIFLLITILLFFLCTPFSQWIIIGGFSFLMLIWLSGRIYSSVHSPLFLENLAIGIAKMDTLYHSSIMQMLKTYGISSTGLNGTPYLAYHWGSHWILSKFSILLNTSAITTYNLVYPALFICLYFKASLTFTYDIFRQFLKSHITLHKTGLMFWLVFLFIQVGFMPYSFLYNWAVWDSWIESESYSIALIFFFIFGSICLSLFNFVVKKPSTRAKVLLLFIPVCIPLLGLLKISLLIIALSVLVYVFLKLQLFRSLINILVVIITVCLSYFVLRITASTYTGEENNNFYLFHFLKSQMISNWKGLFYYVHYFWTILYIVLRCTSIQDFNFDKLKAAFFSHKLIDVEVLILISLVGLLPASVFRIDGGSAFYFTDIQSRVAGTFLLAYVLADSVNDVQNSHSLIYYCRRYALVLPLLIILLLSNIFSKIESAININLATRIQLASLYDGPKGFLEGATADILQYTAGKKSEVYYKLRQLKYIPPAGLRENPRYLFLKHLSLLDRLPLSTKQDLVIHIPQNYDWFWKQSLENFYATPFIIPSLTGIASAGSLPASVDPYHFLNYGYHTYRASLDNSDYKSLSKDNICSYTSKKGLEKISVLIIDPESIKADTLSCSR